MAISLNILITCLCIVRFICDVYTLFEKSLQFFNGKCVQFSGTFECTVLLGTNCYTCKGNPGDSGHRVIPDTG